MEPDTNMAKRSFAKRLKIFFFFWFTFLFIGPFVGLAHSIRYRYTIKGLDKLNPEIFTQPGGILFLANHPAIFIDPTYIVAVSYWKFRLRPLVEERMYNLVFFKPILYLIRSIPIPLIHKFFNERESKINQEKILKIINDLKAGDNFLIFPAGIIKRTPQEKIAGTTIVYRILQQIPKANIVLVRTTGMWGSIFSTALIGDTPPVAETIWQGLCIALKNLIFFTPKRDVTIEFEPAPADFPYQGSRVQLNEYLENWFNRYKSGSITFRDEPLTLVSYSRWRDDFPAIPDKGEDFDLGRVRYETIIKVIGYLSKITGIPIEKIMPEMSLSEDLGIDSIDAIEIGTYLTDEFKVDIDHVPLDKIVTVKALIGVAAGEIVYKEDTHH